MIFIGRRPSLWSPTELNLNLSLPRSPTERAKKELLRHGLFLIIQSSKELENWSKLVLNVFLVKVNLENRFGTLYT